MNWKIIFNPFKKFSERQLLVAGILITFLGSWVAAVFKNGFVGLLNVRMPSAQTFLKALANNTLIIVLVFTFLMIVAKIINRKTRVVDIFNAALVYRLPIYLSVLFLNWFGIDKYIKNLNTANHAEAIANMQKNSGDLIFLTLFGIAAILLIVWAISLLFNGFKTATNAKKTWHYVLFAVTILLVDIAGRFAGSIFH